MPDSSRDSAKDKAAAGRLTASAEASGEDLSMGDVLFDPAIRGLFSDDEIDALFAREPNVGRDTGFGSDLD